jgi:acyl-CoA thioester hydrolase
MSYKHIEEKGIFLPVSEAHCKYLSPIKYDEVFIIETSLDTEVKGSFKFHYRLLGESPETVLAKGFTKHPCINENGKVVRPPRFLLDIVAQADGKDKAHIDNQMPRKEDG